MSDPIEPRETVLCVDLDGSLCRGDSMVHCALHLLSRRPWLLPRYGLWGLRGRARLKAEIARRAVFDPARLTYHSGLIAWLREEKAKGRRIVIASGADQRIVAAIAAHLGLFDEVLGSDGRVNLTGHRKAAALARRFGDFAYVGNSRVDVAVWRRASDAYLVAGRPRLAAKLSRKVKFRRVFSTQ